MNLFRSKGSAVADQGGSKGIATKAAERTGRRLGYLTTVAVLILVAVALAATATVYAIGYQNVEEYKSLGPWGDFSGGVLNPFLTFITFIAVIITVFLQKEELSLTRDEMSRSAAALEAQTETLNRQAFENTFFEMLRFHSTIVESIDLQNPENGQVTKGRDAFRVFYTRFSKIYRENALKAKGKHDDRSVVILSYHLFWKDAGPELSHYFRFLFNFFRMIEKSEFSEEHYGKLLRSQLSDQELLLIFYNNVTERGAPFAYYADKFELFDNLPVVKLLSEHHAAFASKKAFGKNTMEFRPKAK